jgi:uncharacterized protein YpmB
MTKMAILIALVLISSVSAYAGSGSGNDTRKQDACERAESNARIQVNNGTHVYVGSQNCVCKSYVTGYKTWDWDCEVKTRELPPREPSRLVFPTSR